MVPATMHPQFLFFVTDAGVATGEPPAACRRRMPAGGAEAVANPRGRGGLAALRPGCNRALFPVIGRLTVVPLL